MEKRKSKAVVVRFSSLGDIVLCSAFVKKWHEQHPDGEMIFVTSAAYAAIVKNFPQHPEIFALPRLGAARAFVRGWKFFLQHRESPLEIYDLQANLRSRAFLLGLRLAHLLRRGRWLTRAQSPRRTWRRLASVWLRRDLLGPRKVFVEHQKLLAASDFLSPELLTERREGWDHLRSGAILLAPDSQHWKKRIPPSMCEDLVNDILLRSFERVTLVGPANYLAAATIARWEEKYPGRLQNLLGQTQIEDLAYIASLHRLCLCGNSAWLHIAEAVGVPVLSFAGPIVEGFGFAPWRPESYELSLPLACRPCTRHGGGRCELVGSEFHACVKRVDWRPRLKEFLETSL